MRSEPERPDDVAALPSDGSFLWWLLSTPKWAEIALGALATALGYGLHLGVFWVITGSFTGHALSGAQSEELTRLFWLSLATAALAIVVLSAMFAHLWRRSTEVALWVAIALSLILVAPYFLFLERVLPVLNTD